MSVTDDGLGLLLFGKPQFLTYQWNQKKDCFRCSLSVRPVLPAGGCLSSLRPDISTMANPV